MSSSLLGQAEYFFLFGCGMQCDTLDALRHKKLPTDRYTSLGIDIFNPVQ
jgi:hypothetical protein